MGYEIPKLNGQKHVHSIPSGGLFHRRTASTSAMYKKERLNSLWYQTSAAYILTAYLPLLTYLPLCPGTYFSAGCPHTHTCFPPTCVYFYPPDQIVYSGRSPRKDSSIAVARVCVVFPSRY